ncbi:hypothetical protein Pmani_025145 [Petrolisthes manimaculis]|uniref:Major facilitator superfamily (MFS) profile domain-containing protein n=1 Tax=Petrolisthes manimaculis TaxID=1843537 RepID=A0AAE1P7B2_9EUCA|nr:hypothetical protein Pmani_025145 [Petrolisthes manimaculis]
MGTFTRDEETHGRDNEGLEIEENCMKTRDETASVTQSKDIYTIAYKTPTTTKLDDGDGGSGGGSGPWWGTRHTLGLLLYLGLALAYMVRFILSIAIVAMVDTKPKDDDNETAQDLNNKCPLPNVTNTNNSDYGDGDFDWDSRTQGIILGSFFYGYTASNFIGGRAAEYFGGCLVFGLGVVVPSFLSLFSALCASISKDLFIVLRVLEGLTQGAIFPSISTIMAAWIPPKERGSYCALVFSGTALGTILGMAVGGWLCKTTFLGGWPSVFYVSGGLGVAWGLPWFLLAHDLPEQHPTMTRAELTYITSNRTFITQEKRAPLPIRDIATSIPFWTLMVTTFGYCYESYLLLTMLPTYFSNIQHLDIDSNGLISSLPHIIKIFTTLAWSTMVYQLTIRNIITVKTVRKLSTGVAMYMCSLGLITMIWVDCNKVLSIVVMSAAVSSLGALDSGAVLSEQDIAPNFAGSLKGLTNTLGSATGFLAPAITGFIINDNQTLKGWSTVFGTGALIGIVCVTQYMIFGTDKVQPWNESNKGKSHQSVSEANKA